MRGVRCERHRQHAGVATQGADTEYAARAEHDAATRGVALERCTPLHFSEGLGNAVAGRPIAIRFVDNRDQP